MRVTNQLLSSMLQNNMNTTTSKMLTIIEQANTGLRINRPSDNPISYSIARRYDKQIQQNERYLENNAVASGWLERQNSSVSEFKNAMDSAFVLLEQAANGTTTPEQLDTIAYELRQIMKQLMSTANNTFNGDYIFGGVNFEQAPYQEGIAVDSAIADISAQGNPSKTIMIEAPNGNVQIPSNTAQNFSIIHTDGTTTTVTLAPNTTTLDLGDGITLSLPTAQTTYNGETIIIRPAMIYTGTLDPNDTFNVEIMEGQRIETSGIGGLIFGGRIDASSTNANLPLSQNTNAFETLGKMIAAIETHDRATISNMLTPMNESITHIVNYQATLGGRINRLALAKEMVTNSTDISKESRSEVQDADPISLLEQERMLEVQYQLSASLLSRINSMSLINYL